MKPIVKQGNCDRTRTGTIELMASVELQNRSMVFQTGQSMILPNITLGYGQILWLTLPYKFKKSLMA
jgi:hypothetical protein